MWRMASPPTIAMILRRASAWLSSVVSELLISRQIWWSRSALGSRSLGACSRGEYDHSSTARMTFISPSLPRAAGRGGEGRVEGGGIWRDRKSDHALQRGEPVGGVRLNHHNCTTAIFRNANTVRGQTLPRDQGFWRCCRAPARKRCRIWTRRIPASQAMKMRSMRVLAWMRKRSPQAGIGRKVARFRLF